MPTSTVLLSLNSSMRWGRLTEAHVTQAVGDPTELAASTRAELANLLDTHADAFEPAARDALVRALATPERTWDPALAKLVAFRSVDNSEVSWSHVPGGQLVRDGFSPADVQQGSLGDCYFLATLAGFAATKPQVLQDAIKDNGNGTFTVRFFERDPVYGVQPVLITVDGDLPTKFGAPVYARTPNGELWPALLEKAFAKRQGSYGLIGNGGLPGEVAFALTGDEPSMRLVAFTSEQKTFERIERALGRDQAVMVVTATERLRPAGFPLEGLVTSHVYSVSKAFERDGQQWITVRNPWGEQPWDNTPRGMIAPEADGAITLTVEEFKAGFPAAFIAD
jgi:hypothetical protein